MDCQNIRHFIAVGILLLRCRCSGFNVDVSSPIVRFDRSGSLFGYSVALHRGNDSQFSMLIGAPRAQTSQPDVERGGAVYRCPVASDDCEQVNFDTTGQPMDGQGDVIGSKSNQFFGATLHSTDEPGGPVVACAPRRVWSFERFNQSDTPRFLTGACFVASNDFGNIQEFTPCEQREILEPSTLGVQGISYCQAGFSASISEDGKLLLGAPGSFYWQGQLVMIDLSRPDNVVYTPENEDAFFDNFYKGYTVTRGRFGDTGIYAVAKPRANDFLGIVSFFDESLCPMGTIEGEQMSAYFGHALVASDLNADGFDDLIVGAPMFVDPDNLIDRWEVGRVYVYCQDAQGIFEKSDFLTGTTAGGQFGFVIAALGDVNRDGFNDIAIGAPFADSGIVYIYHGRRRGIKQTPAQVLRPIDFGLNIRSFGTSLAGGLDVDGNFYNDLLIGAYMSSTAVLVRSRPIVRIQRSLTFKPKQINLDTRDFTLPSGQTVSSFNLTTCLSASGLDIPNIVAVKYSLQLDAILSTTSRVAFVLGNNFDESEVTRTVQLVTDVEMCQTDLVYVKLVIQNKIQPIAVRLFYELAPEATSIQGDAPGNISTVVPPILAPTTHPVESLLIRNTCKNDLCVPDLLLTASSNTERVIVGDNWEANVEVSVANYGEDAYEAAFQAVLPDGMTFVRVERISTDFSVTCSSEEDSGVVNCDIGNPFPEDYTVEFRLTLADDQLSGDSDKLVVSMNVGSLNYEPMNITADNYANVTIGVEAYAELGIYGGSNPQQVLYRRPSNTSFVPPEPKTEEDVGPEVEHVYMLRNLGPSKVGRTRVDIYWPLLASEGGYLLYVISAKVGTGENCWVQGGVNPENLEPEQKEDTQKTSDTANLLTRKRRQSDSDSSAEALPQVGSGVAMECYQVSPGCVLITCNMSAPSVVGINEDSSIIRIRSKLYENTFMKGDYSQVLISSTANASVLSMPYRESILPDQFPTASSQVTTQVIAQSLETPGSPSKEVIVIPLWVYIVAIVGGSAILVLVIFAMWKCGFFKRKKIVPKSPQAEAEETWQNDMLVDEKD